MNATLDRPETTLFMIESLDGKITTGDNDTLDVDKDFKRIEGVMEGLHQYYELEQQTDLHSLNSGRVMEKIGVNKRTKKPNKIAASFIIIDNKPHLTEQGVIYLSDWVNKLYLVTTNKSHPAHSLKKTRDNIHVIHADEKVELPALLQQLKQEFGIEKLTIQSGGTLNAQWIREGLIDHVSIVIAPCLIGGNDTQSLIGGESLHTEEDLKNIKALKLISCNVLNDSYIHVLYDVIQETKVSSSSK